MWVNSRYTTGVRARAPFPPPPPLVRSLVPDCAISSLFKHYYQRVPLMTCLCSLSGLNWTTNQVIIPSNIPCSSPFEISVKICHQELNCNHPINDQDNRHRVVKVSQ